MFEIKTMQHMKVLNELQKDQKRLDWLLDLLDNCGVFKEEQAVEIGINKENAKELIDMLMDIPIDELLAKFSQKSQQGN